MSSYFKNHVWTYEFSSGTKENKEHLLKLYQFIFSKLEKANIILIGYLSGCLKCLNLATKFIQIRALILISPKGLNKIKSTHNLISLACPIFIVHGKCDRSSDYKSSIEFGRQINNLFEWYPRSADHSNILQKYRSKLYIKIKIFFKNTESTYFNNLVTSHTDNGTETFSIVKSNIIHSNPCKIIHIKFEDDLISKNTNQGFLIHNKKYILNNTETEYFRLDDCPFDKKSN